MLNKLSEKRKAILYTCLWAVVIFFFSLYTDLADDEAYYWVYAKNLDWGYFDHPPMIALMIKVGTFFFNNEMSIRFCTVIASALTLYLLFAITEFKKVNQLFLLFITVPAFHALSFISAPDVPMLFFGVLYLYCFKKYLENDSIKNVLLLSLVIALLMYSKYHGVLLVIFSLIPNYKLLTRKSFYVVFVLSLIFFAPHIWWQAQNGFPSVYFHLFDRVNTAYQPRYTGDYLLGQLAFAGPVLFFLMIILMRKVKGEWIKTLKWTALGFYFFFLVMSFRSFVEANWVAMGYVGALLVVHTALDHLNKLLKISITVVVLILIGLRIYIALPGDKKQFLVTEQFGRNKEYYKKYNELAGERAVVFVNTYQKASKYSFYFNQPSFTLNSYWYRRNQYDRWLIQQELQGKKVLVVGAFSFSNSKSIRHYNDDLFYAYDDHLKTQGYITLKSDVNKFEVKKGDTISGELSIENPAIKTVHYDTTKLQVLAFLKMLGGDHEYVISAAEINEQQLISEEKIKFKIPINCEKGEYKLVFGFASKYATMLWNSSVCKVEIK